MFGISSKLAGLKNSLKMFHEDEDGLETIQVVMIIAIAAVVLIVVKLYWNDIKQWAGNLLTDLLNTDAAKQKA
jgi:hypothetical protein